MASESVDALRLQLRRVRRARIDGADANDESSKSGGRAWRHVGQEGCGCRGFQRIVQSRRSGGAIAINVASAASAASAASVVAANTPFPWILRAPVRVRLIFRLWPLAIQAPGGVGAERDVL